MAREAARQALEETWAFCPECMRWYYCPCQLEQAGSPSRCPVCAADPETVETLPGGR